MKKMGLGRGLDALLPDEEQAQVEQIALDDIDINRDQPRRTFNEESLAALADSIREQGVIVPLLVVRTGLRYRIVAGERRFRASRMAGLQSVPCIVRELSIQQEMETALIENIQRQDLNPIEEAQGIRALMDECGYTQETAAKRLGKSRPAVANSLRLLTLEEPIRQAVIAGTISAGHARVLAGVSGARREKLFQKAVLDHLSVRQLEQLANEPEPTPRTPPQKRTLAPELSDMQERFCRAVGIRAAIQGSEKKGRLILTYQSAEELDMLYAALQELEGK